MFKKATTCAILYVCGTFTLAFKFFHQISQIDDFCRSQNTLKGQLLSNIFWDVYAEKGTEMASHIMHRYYYWYEFLSSFFLCIIYT